MNSPNDNMKIPILCMGGINIDWLATSPNNVFPNDSIPYKFVSTIGGVAHNVAQNLHDLTHEVHLLSFVGNDKFGKKIRQFLQKTGIHCSHVYTVAGQSTASIIFVNGANGEQLLHIARTEIYDVFKPEYLTPILTEIHRFPIWVVDTDLNRQTLEFIAHNRLQTSKIFAIITTTEKASRLKPILPCCEGIFLNKAEAAQLFQTQIESEAEVLNASDQLRNHGIPYVFITMGKEGVCVNTPQYRGVILPLPANVKNTVGAGDAFAAAVINGLLCNIYTIEEIIYRGLTAASLIVENKFKHYGISSKMMKERGLQIV